MTSIYLQMNMIQLPDYKYDDLKFINNYCKVCNLDTSIYDIKTLNKGIDEVIRNVCHLEDDEIIQ